MVLLHLQAPFPRAPRAHQQGASLQVRGDTRRSQRPAALGPAIIPSPTRLTSLDSSSASELPFFAFFLLLLPPRACCCLGVAAAEPALLPLPPPPSLGLQKGEGALAGEGAAAGPPSKNLDRLASSWPAALAAPLPLLGGGALACARVLQVLQVRVRAP